MDLGELLAAHPGYDEHVDKHIDAIRQNFERTKYLLTQDVSNDNFNDAFQNFYKIISIIPLLKNQIKVPQIVRARTNYDGVLFKEKSDLSYNIKRQDLIKLGRFNRELEPLFYGSLPLENPNIDYVLACALECCKELTDQINPPAIQDFTIGGWLVQQPFDVITLCFDERHLEGNPSLKEGVDLYLNAINTNLSPKSSAFITEFLYFYSDLSSKPAIDNRMYYVLTALFVAIRYYYKTVEKQKIFGLIYPSAMTESRGLNIVVTRHAVDHFLKLDKVVMYRFFLEKSNKTYFGYPCSKLAKVAGDTFKIPDYISPATRTNSYL